MTDPEVSEAARAVSAARWGSQRPTRMARELARRAAEVPEAERAELLEALNRHADDLPDRRA